MRRQTSVSVVCLPFMALACSSAASSGPATASVDLSTSTQSAPSGVARAGLHTARTPIKHAIVIVGENRTFDHVFATYKPKGNQRIWNLLSRGIVNEDGTPGPNFHRAVQRSAVDHDVFEMSPPDKRPYSVLPAPLTGGPTTPYFSTVAAAQQAENGLAPEYYPLLTTGGTGLPSRVPDTRIPNVTSLPPGPFQLTPGVSYDAYAASPVHRFYQMWQQLDCSASHSTSANPAGCRSDLFPWVEVTVGAGTNGKPQPTPFTDATTGEGATSMAFYNVLQGDMPYFKELADTYAMSDNYHQFFEGGTGANSVAIGTADAIWYSDGKGHAATPPANEIENPNPQPGTNNWYVEDGYSGGTYSNCSDPGQPGVGPVRDYLASLPFSVDPNCDPGHYYLLNNYAPGYFGDGTVNADPFAIPPSTLPTIGDTLSADGVSWKYYGDQWNRYLADPTYQNPLNNYCDICNPFQYSTSIMTDPAARAEHLNDTIDLYADIQNGTLPAVSFVKPSGIVDGHPASSKFDLFEGFVKKIVDQIKSDPALWNDTAIFVTVDEGGGYYDSGYVQPLDFFGDGTRIPLIVVSPHATGGRVSHKYSDHASISKFIERNWNLAPVSGRSRDNLPNPQADERDPWVPRNGAAIDDLVDLFDFAHEGGHHQDEDR